MTKESLSRFEDVIYTVTVITVFLFYTYFVLFGIYFGNLGNEYVAILSVAATFSGTVLAIFFALLSLSVQNVMGKYPAIFLQKITHSKVFSSFLITVVISLSSNLLFIFWGANSYIVRSTLILAIFIAVSVLYMIYYSLRFLNIAYLIKSISTDIKTYCRKSIKKQTPSFSVEESVCQKIEIMVDPIVGAAVKAANENHEEIFTAGIREIEGITNNYLELRKDFTNPYDRFLSYIRDQFSDLTRVARKAPNQRLVPNMIDSLASMAIATTDVKQVRYALGENDLVMAFTNLLESIILSEELLKETSFAPTRGCDKLGTIGIECLRKGLTLPVGYSVVPSLSKIGRKVIALPRRIVPSAWKDAIVQRVIKSQMEILLTAFHCFPELRGNKVINVKHILDSIFVTVERYIEKQ